MSTRLTRLKRALLARAPGASVSTATARKERTLAHGAERVFGVASESIEEGYGVHPVNFLPDEGRVPQLAESRAAGRIGTHAARDVFIVGDLQVGFKFLSLLAIRLLPIAPFHFPLQTVHR